jgi:glucan phosphoethanolaminetransferase (alkaline phosphatase superfamily)
MIADLAIRYSYLRVLPPALLQHFLYSFIFEWMLCFLISWLIAAVWRQRISFIVIPAALLSVIQLTVYGHYFYFGVLPNPYSITYMIDRSADSFSLIASSVTWMHVVLFVLATAVHTGFLFAGVRGMESVPVTYRRAIAGVFAAVILVFNNNVRFAPASYSVSPATIFSVKYAVQDRWLHSGMELDRGNMRRRFEIAERPRVKTNYNCILFISESLRKRNFSSYGYSRETTPFIDSMMAAGSVIRFHHHMTNAVSTRYSVPMILSGAFSIAGSDRPFIYDYLQRWTDAKSYFFTSQSMQRSNIDLVYNTSLEQFVCQEELPYAPFNDLGADDADVAGMLQQFYEQRNGERFFTIVQFNNTHFPYTGKASTMRFVSSEDSAVIDRYDNTIHEQDDLLRSYFGTFRTAGLLDSTVIIFTSDHGEAFGERGHMGHLNTLYGEEVEVPLWIYLPPGFPEAKKEAIRRNALTITSHLDLFPTVMDLFGIARDAAAAGPMAGASLLQPMADERVIPIVGKDMIDTKAVVIGPMKFIETIRDGIVHYEAYHLRNDSQERRNLWSSIPAALQRNVQERLRHVDMASTGSLKN